MLKIEGRTQSMLTEYLLSMAIGKLTLDKVQDRYAEFIKA